MAPPADWYLPPRSSKWIIRCKASPSLTYPSITITAEDYEGVFHVSGDNVDEFAEQIATALQEKGKAAGLTEEIAAVEIGALTGITYGRRGKVKNSIVERLLMETVVAGRKYTIELRTRKGAAQRFRPYLLAVAGGITFLEAEAAQPEEKPPAKPDPKALESEVEYEEEL